MKKCNFDSKMIGISHWFERINIIELHAKMAIRMNHHVMSDDMSMS